MTQNNSREIWSVEKTGDIFNSDDNLEDHSDKSKIYFQGPER